MSDKQTKFPTVEETNSRLSAPVRPAGYVELEQDVEAPVTVESNIESNKAPQGAASASFACDQCDFVAKSANGLTSHQQKHNAK